MQLPFRMYALAIILGVGAIAAPAAPAEDKKAEGWIQLFNGKDLTGWKIPDPPSGNFKSVKETKNDDGKVIAFVGVTKDDKEITLWQVKDGTIVGGGPASHIFTEIEADDFRYRVEAKINDKGNSGQYFRTMRSGVPFGLRGPDQRDPRRPHQDRQPLSRWPHQARAVQERHLRDEHGGPQAR